MDKAQVGRGYFYEGQDILLLARIERQTGAVLGSADVTASSAVTVSVYDLSSATPTTAVVQNSSSVTVGNVLLDPVQGTSIGWEDDDLGANFKMRLYDNAVNSASDAGVIVFGTTSATGGHRYLIEVTFPTLYDGLAALTWEASCLTLRSQ